MSNTVPDKGDTEMAYAARKPGRAGYVSICTAEKRYSKDIADFIAENVASGYVIEYVTRSEAAAGFREYVHG